MMEAESETGCATGDLRPHSLHSHNLRMQSIGSIGYRARGGGLQP